MWILVLMLLSGVFAKQSNNPKSELDSDLNNLRNASKLMGIQLQITNESHIIYQFSGGLKDNIKPIKDSTLFGVASLSKSVTASAIMMLVQQNKIKLNQSLQSILGFEVTNPYFPNIAITIQMILSHQSSLVQCQPYYSQFLQPTYHAKSGYEIPALRQILVKGGKYYNECLYSCNYPPGTHFQYVNLNYGIAGAIIQIITNIRFDIFMQQRLLKHISVGLSEIATFNPATISTYDNLGAAFVAQNGKWIGQYDYYPDGVIPSRNLTGYVTGSSGVVFSPQAGMRASVSHLSNYMIMLANKGVTKEGKRLLSQKSVLEILKPRYQYHGKNSRAIQDYNLYGFGIYTTSYRKSDNIIPHEVVRGHLGGDHGMISAFYFWKNYTLTYIINGALDGYTDVQGSFYEGQRVYIVKAVDKFLNQVISK